MNNEKISVIIASFNGIKYISQQLDSIRTQTRRPDEVIISDDCSTDGTLEFCRDYISQHGLTDWKVFQNEKNLGFAKNFRHAFTLSNLAGKKGNIVFTCDQDDIWMPDKIQVMSHTIINNSQIMLLVSNYIPFNESNGKKIQAHVRYINRDDGEIIQFKLSDTWLEPLRPGCTYCFRSELLEKFHIFDIEGSAHDGRLWRYAIISDSLYLLNRQLIRYRRHEGTTTQVFKNQKPANLKSRVTSSLNLANFYMTFVNAPEESGITKRNRELLAQKAKFLTKRSKVLATKNLFAIILFVFVNIKYYPTMRNALSDIYAAIFLKN